MNKQYELLLFDIDGTLLDYNEAERNALRKTVLDFGFDYNEEEHLPVYQEINEIIWQKFERGKVTAVEIRSDRFRKFAAEIGLEVDADDMSRLYLKNLAEEAAFLPCALEVVKSLHGKFKLALVTNGLSDVQYRRIEKSGLDQYFPVIIVSEEVGTPKPSRKIFEHTLERCNHSNTETTLIIGDSLKSDIRGGMDYGIDTCWLNPDGREHDLDREPTYIISGVDGLLSIVLPD